MYRNRNQIIKAVSAVTILTVVAKIAGFFKQIVIASAFGTTIETDIISLAQGLVSDFDFFITHALVTALMAVYINNKAEENNGKELIGDIYKLFIPLSIIFSIIFFSLSNLFAGIVAPSYGGVILGKLSKIIKMLAPLIVCQISVAISSSVLTANKRFLWQQFIGINQSIIIILSVLFLKKCFGVEILIYSFLGAALVNTLFTGIPAIKYAKISLTNPLKNKELRSVVRMMIPLLFGYAMIYVNQIVDKVLSSGLDDGMVTALSYSAVLLNLVLTLITSTLSVLFVYITSKIAENDLNGVSRLTVTSLTGLIAVFLPVSILVCLCGSDIVEIVYLRGAFNDSGVLMASSALIGYGISIVPYCIRELFARLLYGYQDTKHPMINSSIGIVFNIIASILLCPIWGVFGITLGSSLADIICAILNVFTAKKVVKKLDFLFLYKRIPILLIGASVSVFAVFVGKRIMSETSAVIRFIVVSTISMLGAYIVYIPILKPLFMSLNHKR